MRWERCWDTDLTESAEMDVEFELSFIIAGLNSYGETWLNAGSPLWSHTDV